MSIATFLPGIMGGAAGGGSPAWVSDPYAINDTDFPGPAGSSIQLLSSGVVRALKVAGASPSDIGRWDNNLSLTISDYDFQFAQTSGPTLNTPGGSAADVWINGVTGMQWGVIELGADIITVLGDLLMRPAGGGATIDSAPVTLTVETL